MGTEHQNATKIPTLKQLSIAALKNAAWNPPDRIKKHNIKDLIESLSRYGLWSPITVTSSNRIIMGHRRVAAAKELGWKFILGFVRDDMEMDAVYAEDAHTARKMSGHDSLGVWLKNKKAVGAKQAAWYETMTEALGIGRVQDLHNKGYGFTLYRRGKQICKYVDKLDDNAFLVEAVMWLINQEMSSMVQQAMARQILPSTLVKAIKKGVRLKMGAELDI